MGRVYDGTNSTPSVLAPCATILNLTDRQRMTEKMFSLNDPLKETTT